MDEFYQNTVIPENKAKASTSLSDSSLLNLTPEQLAKRKQDILNAFKDSDISNANSEYTK